jgi:hypothetical protein
LSELVSSALSDLRILRSGTTGFQVFRCAALLGLFHVGFCGTPQAVSCFDPDWVAGWAGELVLMEQPRKQGYKTYSGPVLHAGTQRGVL